MYDILTILIRISQMDKNGYPTTGSNPSPRHPTNNAFTTGNGYNRNSGNDETFQDPASTCPKPPAAWSPWTRSGV